MASDREKNAETKVAWMKGNSSASKNPAGNRIKDNEKTNKNASLHRGGKW